MLWKKIQFFIIGQCLLHSQSNWWLPWMISVTEKSSPIHRNQNIHNFAVCLVPTRGLINHIVNNHNKMAAARNVRKFTLPSFKNVLSLDSGSLLPWVLQLLKRMYGLNTLDDRFSVSTRFSSSSGNRNRCPCATHTRHTHEASRCLVCVAQGHLFRFYNSVLVLSLWKQIIML